MTAGPSACDLVAVPTVVDTEAAEGGVFTEMATGSPVTGPTGAVWRAGLCVGAGLSVRGLLGVTGLAAAWPGACWEGLRVPAGLLAFAVVAAAVRGEALGCGAPLGAGVREPGAAVEDGAGCAQVGARAVGTPAVAAEGPASVLGAVPAVTAAGSVLAADVSLASMTGESVTGLVSSDVSLKRVLVVFSDARFVTESSCISLRCTDP